MYSIRKPYECLKTVGEFYEITILEDIDLEGRDITAVIRGELRGWRFDERCGVLHAIIWEIGRSRADEFYTGDILAAKSMEAPINSKNMFYNSFKGRTVEIGQKVDIYRNLHTNNGYSVRCSKTGLVLAHCSSVLVKNARFIVSEKGRLKTVNERRKRVHAFVGGELVAYNVQIPFNFITVRYNPYYTKLFMEANTNRSVLGAEEVFCSGKYAYAKNFIYGNEEVEVLR